MAEPERRSFLRWAVHGMGALVGALLGIPAVAYLIDARNRPPRSAGFRPVQGVRLSELKEREPPRQGTIYDVRRDAWTLHPNDVVGRVWVEKTGPRPQDLRVFTTICPHLGCSINLNADGAGFTCPCHNAQFTLAGERVEQAGYQNPAPRGMDTLEWQNHPTNPDVLLVKFENFYQGRHDKVAKA